MMVAEPDYKAENRVYQSQLRIVVDRIEKWIAYQRNQADVHGWPESTQIERLAGEKEAAIRAGIKGAGITGERVYACMIPPTGPGRDWDEEIETDDAIRSMPGKLRRVLKANYLDSGTQELKSNRLRIAETTFKARLNMAHCCLIGWGSAHGWYVGIDYRR